MRPFAFLVFHFKYKNNTSISWFTSTLYLCYFILKIAVEYKNNQMVYHNV